MSGKLPFFRVVKFKWDFTTFHDYRIVNSNLYFCVFSVVSKIL